MKEQPQPDPRQARRSVDPREEAGPAYPDNFAVVPGSPTKISTSYFPDGPVTYQLPTAAAATYLTTMPKPIVQGGTNPFILQCQPGVQGSADAFIFGVDFAPGSFSAAASKDKIWKIELLSQTSIRIYSGLEGPSGWPQATVISTPNGCSAPVAHQAVKDVYSNCPDLKDSLFAFLGYEWVDGSAPSPKEDSAVFCIELGPATWS